MYPDRLISLCAPKEAASDDLKVPAASSSNLICDPKTPDLVGAYSIYPFTACFRYSVNANVWIWFPSALLRYMCSGISLANESLLDTWPCFANPLPTGIDRSISTNSTLVAPGFVFRNLLELYAAGVSERLNSVPTVFGKVAPICSPSTPGTKLIFGPWTNFLKVLSPVLDIMDCPTRLGFESSG